MSPPGHPWVSTKNFSPIGPAVWPTIGNIYTNVLFYYIRLLAEGPGVARGKKNFKIKKKISNVFLAYVTPRPPMSVHKKIQPNRSSRLAGYREHIYECLVLLYRLVERNILSVWVELLMYFVNFLFFYVYFFQETQIKEERKGVMCSSFQKIKWIWIQNEILIRISEKKINFKRRQPGFCLVCLQKS